MNSHISRHGHNFQAATMFAFALILVLPIIGTAQQPAEKRLEGTALVVNDALGGSYIFEFRSGGAFRATSMDGKESSGSWKQEGDSVSIKLDGKNTEYVGVVKGGQIEGGVKNKTESIWHWTALLEEATPVSSAAVVPVYPAIARAARAQGVVVVLVTVGKDGHVAAASALGGHPLLQQTSMQAARHWEFNSDEGKETRTVRLFFIFHLLNDGKKHEKEELAPKFISNYQLEIRATYDTQVDY
jgi:TonB family protein